MATRRPFVSLDGKRIGPEYPVYFIADIAANHDGDLERAKKLITLAKESGADAAKFQHHDVRKYVSDKGFKSLGGKFSHQGKWSKSVFEVYKDAEVPRGWTEDLKDHCAKVGITFFTTPYDLDTVDFIDPFVPGYKIGSGDIGWYAMLDKVASKGKPVLFAAGAATLTEVMNAHERIRAVNRDLILMQCNTNYTASLENFKYINLNVLKTFSDVFPDTVLGLSDHTPGHETVLGAVALGARAIEKHFTDDTSRPGPDHPFSMDPASWAAMVRSTRLLEQALGGELKKVEANEMETVVLQRRAIRLIRDIGAGERLTRGDIEFQRPCPADAVKPNEFTFIDGRSMKRDMLAGDYLRLSDLQ
jgi:N-acetylneuraminate synthase